MLSLREQRVGIGSTVAVRDLATGEFDVYTLVEPRDADVAANRISSLTPVAHALYGGQAGDVVEVAAPGGRIRLRIESVTPAETDEYG
jgi:transcription elongation GreA/GreB family factor